MQTRSQMKKTAKSSLFSMVIEVKPPMEESKNMGSRSKCEVPAITKFKSFVSNVRNRGSSENLVSSEDIMTESSQSAEDVSVPSSLSPSRICIESTQAATTATVPLVIKKSIVSRFCNITRRFIIFALQTIPSILASVAGLHAIYQIYYASENNNEDQNEIFELLLKKKKM